MIRYLSLFFAIQIITVLTASSILAQSSTAFENANCNASFLGDCVPETSADPLRLDFKSTGVDPRSDTGGKEAFPGNATGADSTVAWMSGNTSAVFASPAPVVGRSGGVITVIGALALAWRVFRRCRGDFIVTRISLWRIG